MKRLLAQFVRFGIVGCLAFIIDFGLLALLVEVFLVDSVIASAVSFLISVIFNYFASMRFVFFRKEGMSRMKEFSIFLTLSIIGLILNVAGMWIGDKVLELNLYCTKIVVTAVVTIFNFVSRKLLLDGEDTPSID